MSKHGHCEGRTTSKTYGIWSTMKSRCNNPNATAYKYYGAKGITVCKRWLKFENFLEDMGKQPPGLTIERLDNNKGYNPDNCVWETWKVQQKHKKCSKLPLSLHKNIIKAKINKLRTQYNHSVINLNTGQIYKNQLELAKSLNVSRQAVSFYFKGLSHKLKGHNYMFYKDYLINKWKDINISFKWRTI